MLYDVVEELGMPATSKYLDRWIIISQRNAGVSRRFLPFGEPITITMDDLPLLPNESDDKQHLKYIYAWKFHAAKDIVSEAWWRGLAEDATKTSSSIYADRLTHSLLRTLTGEISSSSEPIMLDLLLETHRHMGAEMACTHTEALHVAEYTQKTIPDWRDLACLELLRAIALTEEAAQEVLGSKPKDLIIQANLTAPLLDFHSSSNPVLSAIQKFVMLYHLQRIAEELERRCPYIKLAISAYRMIRRTHT